MTEPIRNAIDIIRNVILHKEDSDLLVIPEFRIKHTGKRINATVGNHVNLNWRELGLFLAKIIALFRSSLNSF